MESNYRSLENKRKNHEMKRKNNWKEMHADMQQQQQQQRGRFAGDSSYSSDTRERRGCPNDNGKNQSDYIEQHSCCC